MEKLELLAQKRELNINLQSLRKAGIVPGIIYGHGFENITTSVAAKDFQKIYSRAGESTLVYLKIDNTSYHVLIHDVQIDPLKNQPLHVDFYRVRMDEKITAPVRLVFEGESLAVRDLGGILVKTLDEIEVKALPADLPSELRVDISSLEKFGDTILAKTISVPPKTELQIDPETVIATVQEPRAEEKVEEVAVAPTPEEVEVIKKEKKEEEEETKEEKAK